MKPDLAQFESKNLIPVVNINVDNKTSQEYLKYKSLKQAKYIPYTVIVDARGKVVYEKVGVIRNDELTKETRKHIK